MRIATSFSADQSLASLQRRQQELTEVQQQLTSGQRVNKPSDDPIAAAQAERARAQMSRAQAQQRAVDASRQGAEMSESALGWSGELLQQAREHLLAAGNATLGDAERRGLAQAIQGLRGELLATANRSDGAGRYLFGGQGVDQPPFVDAPGGVRFDAAPGALASGASPDPQTGAPLSIDGGQAFMQVDDPALAGAKLSVFDVLDRVVLELNTPLRNSLQVAQTVSTGLRDLDASANHLSAWRARGGALLNRLDALGERLAQTTLGAQQSLSEAQDLDMLEAISRFQSRQTGYDAALKAYATVQKLSLFDHIG
jgi:flagellar hook-associated protein 3 FlgL